MARYRAGKRDLPVYSMNSENNETALPIGLSASSACPRQGRLFLARVSVISPREIPVVIEEPALRERFNGSRPFQISGRLRSIAQSGLESLELVPTCVHRAYPEGAVAAISLNGGGALVRFSFQLMGVQAGQYWLVGRYAQQPQERVIATLSFRSLGETADRLFFMHIAKTAGTSVKRYFVDTEGAQHCALTLEIDQRWQEGVVPFELRSMRVLAGHVRYQAFVRRMDYWRYVLATVLRPPLLHVISHIAHVRRLADPGQEHRLAQASAPVQGLAHKLAGLDLSDGPTLRRLGAELTPSEQGLFDNCQVRYLGDVRGAERVSIDHFEQAKAALKSFDIVGTTEDLPAFLSAIASRMNWAQPESPPRENLGSGYYGMDPTAPSIQRGLAPLNRVDQRLFGFATRPGNPKRGSAVRSSGIPSMPVTESSV